jgi:hypothetical protein
MGEGPIPRVDFWGSPFPRRVLTTDPVGKAFTARCSFPVRWTSGVETLRSLPLVTQPVWGRVDPVRAPLTWSWRWVLAMGSCPVEGVVSCRRGRVLSNGSGSCPVDGPGDGGRGRSCRRGRVLSPAISTTPLKCLGCTQCL